VAAMAVIIAIGMLYCWSKVMAKMIIQNNIREEAVYQVIVFVVATVFRMAIVENVVALFNDYRLRYTANEALSRYTDSTN
jgi:hypothetical protein